MKDEKNKEEAIKKFVEWAKKREKRLASTYRKWYKEQCKKYPSPGRKVPGKPYHEIVDYGLYVLGLLDGFPHMNGYYIQADYRPLPELRGDTWGQCYRHDIWCKDESTGRPISVACMEECHRDKLTIRILPVEDSVSITNEKR